MKHTIIHRVGLLAALAMTVGACSESTTAPDPDNFRIETRLTTASVPFGKVVVSSPNGIAQGTTVDSLRVTLLKLMVSELKMYPSGGGEWKVRDGGALLVADGAAARVVITADAPTTTYNKINVKFHRLNDQEVQWYAGNADYADFVTADRYTIIVEGTAYENGQAYPFKYGSRIDEDLKFDLTPFTVDDSGVTVIVIEVDPVAVFKDKDTKQVMDPRDPENANRIDGAIKDALNALRK